MFQTNAPPGIRGETQINAESSKRQQCVRATELAKRTGLKIRCAWLSGDKWILMRGSGKDFDGNGHKSFMEVPGGMDSRNARLFWEKYAGEIQRPFLKHAFALCFKGGSISEKGGESSMQDRNVPFNENCAAEGIPANAEMPDGRKAVRVPVAKTMADYLWDHHTKEMYQYVNGLLKTGELNRLTGQQRRGQVIVNIL